MQVAKSLLTRCPLCLPTDSSEAPAHPVHWSRVQSLIPLPLIHLGFILQHLFLIPLFPQLTILVTQSSPLLFNARGNFTSWIIVSLQLRPHMLGELLKGRPRPGGLRMELIRMR